MDLGCGNGLLVYILSSEGHRGFGIDLRKRGIWDLYPTTTVLKTEAITPSEQSLYPDIDWIIGNHSDELSPWIPVIAARSSPTCRYFLLPCCAYEFNGKKYQRKNCQLSQYKDFLEYAKEISKICGFRTRIDRLKIPSTKRICLVGDRRQFSDNGQNEKNKFIQQFIDEKTGAVSTNKTTGAWNADFIPRPDVEKIQNCTKIDKNIEREIVETVFEQLISKKRFSDSFCNPHWNIGGKVSLADLVKNINKDKLKELKSECGGLQTLLKNNSQIFKVCGGVVEVRLPVKFSERVKEDEKRRSEKPNNTQYRYKSKACWFFTNHPDGCPFDDENCSFKH